MNCKRCKDTGKVLVRNRWKFSEFLERKCNTCSSQYIHVKCIDFYPSMNAEHSAIIICQKDNWLIAKIYEGEFAGKEIVFQNKKEYRKDSKPYFELMEK